MKPFHILASRPARCIAFCLAAVLAIAGPAPASAADYNVDSTLDASDADVTDGKCISIRGGCTLRAAVEQANYFGRLYGGSYSISLDREIYPIKDRLVVKASVSITGSGETSTLIDCGGTSFLAITGKLRLSNLTVQLCPGTENRGQLDLSQVRVEESFERAAIRNYGSFIAKTSTFTGNHADDQAPGGAVLYNAVGGSADFFFCHFEGNAAYGHGGVIFNLGTVNVSAGRFAYNAARGDGGAIYNTGDLRLDLVTFEGNSVGQETSQGGALYNAGRAQVSRSAFIRNTAAKGGAIWSSAPLQLVNSTVSENAASQGGGLYGAGEPNALYLANATITKNIAKPSEAYSASGGGLYGAAILRNTILAGNESSGRGHDCHAGPTSQSLSQGYNVIGIEDDCGLLLSPDDSAGSESKPLDPRLLPLDATTWYPPFHALDGSSPAVDHGDPRGCRMPLTEALLESDQIEQTRHQGEACDAGAVEKG